LAVFDYFLDLNIIGEAYIYNFEILN